MLGAATYFNYPEALAGSATDQTFTIGSAMLARLIGLVSNCLVGAVAASLGYALGKLIPER